MAAAYCRRCCFFKLLCFVTLFVQYLDKHNSICSPPSTFKGPFSVSRKLFSASRCGQDLAVARRSTKLPITKWSKHGSTVAALSERGFIKDLSIAVDVEINPGPENFNYMPTASLQTSRPRFSFSRRNLFQLRSCCPKVKLDYYLIHRLKSLGIYRARGRRAGVNSRFGSRQQHHKIPVRVTDHCFLSTTKRARLRPKDTNLHFISTHSSSLPRIIPKCMVINARSLVKVDAASALHMELHSNNCDICIISETWLKPNFPSHLVCPKDYSILRKDRTDRSGGGVAIVCRSDWLLERLDSVFYNAFECLWAKITTPNSSFYVAAVYHPPDPPYCPDDLLEHLTNSCDHLLTGNPNSNLIICGDLNQLDYNDFLTQLNLFQMVNTPTRKNKILDVLITNVPHFWRKVSVTQGLVRSDHSVVLVYPRIPLKAERKTVMFRDVRDHHKLDMDKLLKFHNWDNVYQCGDVNGKLNLFCTKIKTMFDECFPGISVRVSNRDPPFFSPLIKHLLDQRRKLIRRSNMSGNSVSIEIQTLQEKINKLIRDNQVRAVKGNFEKHSAGSKSWWSTVNSLTGRKSTNSQVSSIISPSEINNFFCSINTDPLYKPIDTVTIPESSEMPVLTVSSVTRSLLKLKRTASGPDGIPYWFWKEFAYDLAPVVTHIFNCSLENHIVPDLWKLADITPLPKEPNFKNCTQLRPISLTNVIMRVFERLVYRQELSQYMMNFISFDQFAYRKGHNTTMALIKCQYAWLKWLESGFDCVRIFSFDFSKAFDSVPHDILCSKLKTLDINPYVTNWIISFLQNRKQRVVVDAIVTDYVNINRGVPQGTVLGPILFSIMVNDIKAILPNQNLLVKYADDLTLSIPVKSLANNGNLAAEEVRSIVAWTSANRMQLNFKKTWEMLLRGKSTKALPAPLVSIERKPCLKLLGVTFQSDPCNWDLHFDNIISKASSRLYILRVCKFYGLPLDHLHLLFISLILPIFTYAVEVWGCAYYHKYLSRIDRLFKRAFKLGYCKELFSIENIIILKDKKLWAKITDSDFPTALDDLLPPERTMDTLRKRRHNYILPLVRTERFKRTFINRCLFSY